MTNWLKKTMVGATLAGTVALAAGLAAGPAGATPSPHPQWRIEYADPTVPGDGWVHTPSTRLCDGSVRVAGTTAQMCDGSVRVAIPAP
ncbi:hypothetical protein [Mycobacterium sp. 852002-51961_SCH5331710]|uniref:hypothetical protein n=1 Tax=Mycobacterium sp. 852002-51961_SCH5331710 TaxID=1834105 RepID=UPI0007FCBA98|nr:hypothetical protein [Mycobacterium sp. 852002-51961_SCH5331710]OBB37205.1 hypothetical protein A5752_14210 [Mycobacterium sp. 852002-51961_SCH5331710]